MMKTQDRLIQKNCKLRPVLMILALIVAWLLFVHTTGAGGMGDRYIYDEDNNWRGFTTKEGDIFDEDSNWKGHSSPVYVHPDSWREQTEPDWGYDRRRWEDKR